MKIQCLNALVLTLHPRWPPHTVRHLLQSKTMALSSFPLFSLHKAAAFKLVSSHCLVLLSNGSILVSVLPCLIIFLCVFESKKEITWLASGVEDSASHHFSITCSCPFSFLLNYNNNTILSNMILTNANSVNTQLPPSLSPHLWW